MARASHDHASRARAARRADVVRERRRASRGGRTRREGNTARGHSDRRRAAGTQSRSCARLASRRPVSCARPGCGSSATTSRPCCSTTAGEWPKRRKRSASSVRTLSKGASAGHSARRGRPSSVSLHRTEELYEPSCLTPVCVPVDTAAGEFDAGVFAAGIGGARRAADNDAAISSSSGRRIC